jgi:hypothetical protein
VRPLARPREHRSPTPPARSVVEVADARSLGLLAGAVLVLAGLAAAASGGTPVWSLLRGGPADRVTAATAAVVVGGVVLVVGLVCAVAVHRGGAGGRRRGLPLRTTLLRTLPVIAAAMSVSSLFVIARLAPAAGADGPRYGQDDTTELPGTGGRGLTIIDSREGLLEGEDRRPAADEMRERRLAGRFDPWVLALLGIATAGMLAAAARAWRRPGSSPAVGAWEADEAPAEPAREFVHAAVVDAIDAMLADPDPNTAIIGAYARLLESLHARGVGRRDHEAPMEHLRRALGVMRVRPEPLHEIIALFEIARFSTHRLNETHRERALHALRTAASELSASARPVGVRT